MSMAERLGKGGSEMEKGLEFTWCRGLSQATFKAARLDRALVNDEWRLCFPEGVVCNLTKLTSDHCPLLINTNGFAPIPTALKPFRFQAAWIKHEKFEEFVSTSWDHNCPRDVAYHETETRESGLYGSED
ncbi:uncharacterized protein LOC110738605 [Chenopodium quinoa]|uniref:uncharacterized protein LOC110738605 n=1 Tax=Chenopodium quinoa TaxID=63459 RepID=UPI000B78A15A|nr:uncharacterized protein LOC110738605 [Chenopodium quinoa]